MERILDNIVASKRDEIERARQRRPMRELEQQLATAPPVRDFRAALQVPPGIQLIAEVKKASPSAGAIKPHADVVALANAYEEHGAACISVLTDTPYFQGSLDDLAAIRRATNLPLLRKDFILDSYQVLEARLAGADAVLLIAEILDDVKLRTLITDTHRLGMEALVEFYEPTNLGRVISSGAQLVGINNRNLNTFVTTLEQTVKLGPYAAAGNRCLVSESGIHERADVERVQAAGAKAILVGETLMRAPDPGAKLRELLGRN